MTPRKNKFCSPRVPPNPPEPEIAKWVPPTNFVDRYEEVRKLNSKVIDLNKEDNLVGTRLDYHGVKQFKSGTTQHTFDTKAGATRIWREKEVFKKLHFTLDLKIKIACHISGCFKANKERVKSQ